MLPPTILQKMQLMTGTVYKRGGDGRGSSVEGPASRVRG
jgi:hypothetical protein